MEIVFVISFITWLVILWHVPYKSFKNGDYLFVAFLLSLFAFLSLLGNPSSGVWGGSDNIVGVGVAIYTLPSLVQVFLTKAIEMPLANIILSLIPSLTVVVSVKILQKKPWISYIKYLVLIALPPILVLIIIPIVMTWSSH